MASPPSSPENGDQSEFSAEDSSAKPAASPHHKMSPRNRALFFVTAWLIVLMPFLFWWNTWFGRRLPDKQITEYLQDEKTSAPHSACTHPARRAHGPPRLRSGALVSGINSPGFASRRRSPQHRRLGYGPGHFRAGLSRNAPQDASGFFSDGPWATPRFRWSVSATLPAGLRSSRFFSPPELLLPSRAALRIR